MKRTRDPGTLTQEQRIGEIGALLATGYLRNLQKNSTKCLAEQAETEAQCAPVMNSARLAPTKEAV